MHMDNNRFFKFLKNISKSKFLIPNEPSLVNETVTFFKRNIIEYKVDIVSTIYKQHFLKYSKAKIWFSEANCL